MTATNHLFYVSLFVSMKKHRFFFLVDFIIWTEIIDMVFWPRVYISKQKEKLTRFGFLSATVALDGLMWKFKLIIDPFQFPTNELATIARYD